ncbi:hypothetical protein BT96DRAFT_708264 [Gymnopus androsaceus JB14]|uniref:Uncharacterized protein n=1 Tax=Gymnopus androsaceus JB14 TaxID=1447944 RepID=A0A6A4HP57_9AGAR|nr:hypothetical protein BT96DRAFT_708264 [Gymnopus androsaceus JB14]
MYHNSSQLVFFLNSPVSSSCELPPSVRLAQDLSSSAETKSIFSKSEVATPVTIMEATVKTPLGDVPEHGPFTTITPDAALPAHHNPNSPQFAAGPNSVKGSSATLINFTSRRNLAVLESPALHPRAAREKALHLH